ncbi:MAG: hypothetical protein ACFFD2_00380 [Promethearchaeota archaeon]
MGTINEKGARKMTSTIEDELEELTFLNDVNLFITEWIPFGSNHIIAFNEELDSLGAVEGGLLTSIIDQEPKKCTFFVKEDLTNVVVKKFDPNDFIQFEAAISYENIGTVQQEEHFAVHVDASGRVVYGCELKALVGKTKMHSLDNISRVVADLVADSSTMMMNLLSTYQSRLLELVFFNKPLNRNKFIILTAKSIDPDEDSKFYLKDARYRNELNQIINQVYKARNLHDSGKCFFGSEGLLLITDKLEQYEELLSIIGFFQGLDIFQKNYFSKMFMQWDQVKDARRKIDESKHDPNAISEAQSILSNVSSGVVLMNELLDFMQTAVDSIVVEFEKLKPLSDAQKELIEFIELQDTVEKANTRIKDASLIVAGLKDEIQGVNGLVATLSESQMRQMNEALKDSIVSMDEMTRSSERTGVALNILEVVLTGAIAFDILTLFLGDWAGGDPFIDPSIIHPIFWAPIAITTFLATGYGILRLIRYLEKKSEPNLRVALKLGSKYDPKKLETYLSSQTIKQQQMTVRTGSNINDYTWDVEDTDKWKGNDVNISLYVDKKNKILLSVSVNIDSPKKITTKDASRIIITELIEASVIPEKYKEIIE